MRGMMRSLVAAAFVLGMVASTSHAAPFTGGVGFSLAGLAPLAAVGAGSGVSTTAPNQITIATAAWAQTGPLLITIAPTAAAPLTALNVVLTAPGPCAFTGANLGGSCGLGGTANALVGGAPFLVVPLGGLGVNGRVAFGPYGSYIDAKDWTTALTAVTVNGVTLTTNNATTPGPAIFTAGYDNRTPGGAGTVKLVAPAGLMSTLGGNLPLFVTLTLTYAAAPEPGTLRLLGSGGVGLAVLGPRRRRKA
jgi:hypothetical protein